MRLDHMKEAFPETPERIRTMVETQVRLRAGSAKPVRRSRFTWKTAVCLVSIMTLVAGGTVFAASRGWFTLRGAKEGEYGLKTGISSAAEDTESTESSEEWVLPAEIPEVQLEMADLPADISIQDQDATWAKLDRTDGASLSMQLYVIDETVNTTDLVSRYVVNSENLTLGDHTAVYMEFDREAEGSRLYVLYPEAYRVLEILAEGISQQDLIDLAEKITLTLTGNTVASADEARTWSFLVGNGPRVESEQPDAVYVATAEEIGRAHAVGESFTLPTFAQVDGVVQSDYPMQVNVADVTIGDHVSLLDTGSYMEPELSSQFDADGNLLPNVISYYKEGDGVNELDQLVQTEEIAQKLVYVTLEYTNTGDSDCYNVLFCPNYLNLVEEGGAFHVWDFETRNKKGETIDTAWDTFRVSSPMSGVHEMAWYDVGDPLSNNPNYFPVIKAGATETVHVAFLIDEDQLNTLFLDLTHCGEEPSFGEEGSINLDALVDVR